MTGAILARLSDPEGSPFTPVNAQFGLLPPLQDTALKKDRKRHALADRALEAMRNWLGKQEMPARGDLS